jgi:superfamily II DNA/RNA helicase
MHGADMNFFDLGFSEPFVQFLNSAGYEKPTAIQRALHEPILAGQSVLGLARQGSGSLETLLLPLLARAQAISALVVVPNAEQQLRYQTLQVWQELSQRWHAKAGL